MEKAGLLVRIVIIIIYIILSMNIQPTKGGVAPLYNARTPSWRTVFIKQSNGPLKRSLLDVCMRTLTVSILKNRERGKRGLFIFHAIQI